MKQPEFIAVMAMLVATVAISIDGMLPALPEIGAQLTPEDVNRAQLIMTAWVFGMGVCTLLAGAISDTTGRKSAILAGGVIYVLGAAMAASAQSLDTLLAARVLNGLGSAGPRVVSLGLVRDLRAGRQMARIVSLAMMIFTLVPAMAPSLGTLVIAGVGWRGIFAAVILFSVAAAGWPTLRQPETLARDRRRPLRLKPLGRALAEVATHRSVITATAIETLIYGVLFGTLSSPSRSSP